MQSQKRFGKSDEQLVILVWPNDHIIYIATIREKGH